jgi:uncharacterized protein (DUF2384 family)
MGLFQAAQLIAIKARLQDYYSEAEIEAWLEASHPQLDGQSAIGLIRAGKADKVHDVLDRIDNSTYL